MDKINVYYHELTDSWWTDSKLDGIYFKDACDKSIIGLGEIVIGTTDKSKIADDRIHEIYSYFIPEHIRNFHKVAVEIEENGLTNATKVSKRQLKKLLK